MPYVPVRYLFKDGFYGYYFLYVYEKRKADALPQQKCYCTSRRENREQQKHIAPVRSEKRQKEAAAEADALPLQKRCNRNCSQFDDDNLT